MSNDDREGLLQDPGGSSGTTSSADMGGPVRSAQPSQTEEIDPSKQGDTGGLLSDADVGGTRGEYYEAGEPVVNHEETGSATTGQVMYGREETADQGDSDYAEEPRANTGTGGTVQTYGTTSGADHVEGSSSSGTTGDYVVTGSPESTQTQQSMGTQTQGGGDTERVQRYEEELQAETTQRETGAVRVNKDVVEEQRTLEVPVTREEVHITSHSTGSSDVDTSQAFQGGSIEIPVREEDVEVRKQARVAEELEIEKRAVQDTEQVSDTVRKEVFDVDYEGSVDVNRGQPDINDRVRPQDQ